MNRIIISLLALSAILIGARPAAAETASYGFRLSSVRWKEKGLINGKSLRAEGTMFGPTLLFRLDDADTWALGIDGLYGSLDNMERADVDLTLGYGISSIFTVFLDARYMDYDYEKDKTQFDSRGFGLGPGIAVTAPLGQSGMFFFANTRVLPISLTTDIEDADTTAMLWAYEGGLAFGGNIDIGVNDTSLYVAIGYRHQQMKGGDFDERLQMPFVEFGLRQEF